MDDRTLLELAARAAGFGYGEWTKRGIVFAACDAVWNPLTDDGDALRLAVKLNIIVQPYVSYAMADTQHEDAKGDIQAATRRAIVRAAAALSENKQ